MSELFISPTSAHRALDGETIGIQGMTTQPTVSDPIVCKNSVYFYSKRALDTLIILLGLPFLTPLILLIAIAIKIDSSGPIFFRQKRIGAKRFGHNGESTWEITPFEIFKFRSMYVNSDESIHKEHVKAWINGELEDIADSNAKSKLQNDPRVTRVGRFLRKTSLDEIPQFINVLLVQMSIVGPRPVPEYEVAQYQPEHYQRLHTLPGVTGLWQVLGRGNVSFEEMMELDLEYVRTQSIWQDIKIIVLTLPAVISGAGAE